MTQPWPHHGDLMRLKAVKPFVRVALHCHKGTGGALSQSSLYICIIKKKLISSGFTLFVRPMMYTHLFDDLMHWTMTKSQRQKKKKKKSVMWTRAASRRHGLTLEVCFASPEACSLVVRDTHNIIIMAQPSSGSHLQSPELTFHFFITRQIWWIDGCVFLIDTQQKNSKFCKTNHKARLVCKQNL